MRRAWFQIAVGVLSAGATAGACGGKAVDNAADGPTETVAGEVLLASLSHDEKRAICTELSSLRNDAVRAVVCRHNGISAIGEQLPTTDAQARSVCEDAYLECLNVDPCAELPVFTMDCPVDVAQYRQCAALDLESRTEAYQALPPCSDATKDAPGEYFRVTAPYPELCWPIVPCYNGVESGDD